MDLNTKRVIASIIDLTIICFIGGFISKFIEVNKEVNTINVLNINLVYGYSLMFIIFALYFFCFDFFNYGITFGKSLLKIKTLEQNDKNLSLQKRLIRTIIKMFSLMIFPITLLIFLINEFTIHDSICKTHTINNLAL